MIFCFLAFQIIVISLHMHIGINGVVVRVSLLKQFCMVQARLWAIFWPIFLVFWGLEGPWVQSPAKNGYFTAPCGTHGTSLFKFCIKNCLGWGIWGPADTSGSWSNHLVCTFICSKKSLKIKLFKIGRFKLGNIFILGYTHAPSPFNAPLIPASLNDQ